MNNNELSKNDTEVEGINSEYSIAAGEIIIGTLVAINAEGKALVDFPQNPLSSPSLAMSTTAITQQQVTRQVALLFNQGDLKQPIIMGLIHSPLQAMLESYDPSEDNEKVELAGDLNIDNVSVEGEKVTFEAQSEMVFKCGESSITLTKAGKILIRGKYLLNRSSGVNRIMGGSVQVN